MSDNQDCKTPICDVYPGIKMLNGCAMDQASYEKHLAAQQAAASAAPTPETDPIDPFAVEQDFRAIAAQAFDADRAATQPQETAEPAREYRPSTVQFIETEPVAGQQTMVCEQRYVLCGTTIVMQGSGSYTTSGSYYLTSGSYAFTSGSYYLTSGSYLLGSASSGIVGSNRNALGGYGLHLI